MSEEIALTKLGGLQPNVAAGICYVPVMYVHAIASVVFLLTEPKENAFVRFHAAQSLLITAGWIGATVVLLVLMIAAPLLGIVAGAVVAAASEDLGGLLMLAGILGELFFGLLAILAAFAGPVVLFGMTLTGFMEMDVRIPGLASVARRLVGAP